MSVNMSVDLGGIHMQNPVCTASGTFGAGRQFESFFDVSCLGAITCKGVSAEPWLGNPAPRMAEVTSGVLNSVGLHNPGVKAFVAQFGGYLEELEGRGCRTIAQIAGHSADEYVTALELFEELAPYVSGFELNISCPNLSAGGSAIGSTPGGAAEVTRACRAVTKKPLLVKMAPTNVAEIAKAIEAEGADALTLINTIPGMAIDVHTRKSRLSRPTGGVSGPCIHPIAVRMVWEAAHAVQIPINGTGGIWTGEDAAEFLLAGATAVSVGTASLVDPMAAKKVLGELEAWAEEQGVKDIHELIGAAEC